MSKKNIPRNICRICLVTSSPGNTLIQPCNCINDLAFCHPSCLSKWISSTCSTVCDICQFKFLTIQESFSFIDWLASDEDELKQFILGIFILFISFYMVLLGEVTTSSAQDSNFVTKSLLNFMTFTSEVGYVTWIALFSYFTANRYFEWSETHSKISVFPNALKGKNTLIKPIKLSVKPKTKRTVKLITEKRKPPNDQITIKESSGFIYDRRKVKR